MITRLTIGLLLAVAASAFFPSSAAGVTGVSNLIGGQILLVEVCCNGVKITVGPPKAGIFLFVPGISRLYPNYIMMPGTWVLGTAFGVATCQRLVSFIPCAISEPVPGGIIRMIGTSGVGASLGR